MRFFVFTLLVALLAVFVSASLPQKAVIVSFPNETPDYIVLEAKEGLRAAGGEITHEYHLIKAFAAKASTKAVEAVQIWGQKWSALVEEDEVVRANNHKKRYSRFFRQ